MSKKAVWGVLAPSVVACLLLAGCAPKPAPEPPAATPAPKTEPTKAEPKGEPAKAGKKIVLGFAQVGAESGWREANTKSIQGEATKRGHDLRFSDAQQKQENQIKAIRSYITQKVDVIAFSPVVETGWDTVLGEAKAANIPVILSDRTIKAADESLFTAFVGSDFKTEGVRAGEWLVKRMGGKAKILELQGTPGSAPANARRDGFAEAIKKAAGMKIVLSKTGEFTRAKGKEVMEAFLRTPEGKEANALFAHNDDMAIGAIQAIEAAGKQPGKDIVIVSIDGVKAAFDAMKEGKLNCTVECNPLLGPAMFDLAEKIVGKQEFKKINWSEEGVFDDTNYQTVIDKRQY